EVTETPGGLAGALTGQAGLFHFFAQGPLQTLVARQTQNIAYVVNQRAKLTRNLGETASNFDHPLKSVILRFFTGVTWDCYAWKPLPRFVAVMK
ncbi:hypothetical protein, partial [Thiolapillus sp.]|uniref:hypothetical protein n=1 Tax=Thiolapillus sp. TaxID=2017437 RepID=UPI0025D10CDB